MCGRDLNQSFQVENQFMRNKQKRMAGQGYLVVYSDAIHKICILVRDEQTPVEKYEFYIIEIGKIFANERLDYGQWSTQILYDIAFKQNEWKIFEKKNNRNRFFNIEYDSSYIKRAPFLHNPEWFSDLNDFQRFILLLDDFFLPFFVI